MKEIGWAVMIRRKGTSLGYPNDSYWNEELKQWSATVQHATLYPQAETALPLARTHAERNGDFDAFAVLVDREKGMDPLDQLRGEERFMPKACPNCGNQELDRGKKVGYPIDATCRECRIAMSVMRDARAEDGFRRTEITILWPSGAKGEGEA